MTESEETDTLSNSTGNEATVTSKRRSVLRTIGAIGLGSSFTGLAQARGKPTDAGRSGSAANEIPISTQFWTYNNSDLSVAELIYESADAGYDAVEPYYIDDAEAVGTALEETGLEFSSAHVGIEQLENDFDETVKTYSNFGAEFLVHAYKGGGTWESKDSIISWAERVSAVADKLAAEGMEFGYHNHNQEFQKVDGRYGFDIFAEHISDNVHLQLDVGWAHVAGANPVSILNEYSDSIGSLHMKDMAVTEDGYDFTEIGEGDTQMKALANVARANADVDYLIYEYDGAPNPIQSMNYGADFLERVNGPKHRNRNGQ